MLEVEGPSCVCHGPCFPCENEFKVDWIKVFDNFLIGNYQFKILATDRKTQIGKIALNHGEILKEAFTNADNFGIECNLYRFLKFKIHLWFMFKKKRKLKAFWACWNFSSNLKYQ